MRMIWNALIRERRREGFTLVEIMVVVIIIGLLAGLVAPKVWGQLTKAKLKTARSQIASLCTAVDLYRLDHGDLPSSLESLTQETEEGGPYIDKVPLDPWGSEYQYSPSGENFEISSTGGGKTPVSSRD